MKTALLQADCNEGLAITKARSMKVPAFEIVRTTTLGPIRTVTSALLTICLAWGSASARSQDAADVEAKAALIALLNHTAEKYRESTRVCVDTTLRFFGRASYPAIRRPDTAQRISWYSPKDAADRSLSPELGRQVTEAFSARPAPASGLRTIDYRWLKAPLEPSTTPGCTADAAAKRGQLWTLRLSPPLRSGKFYFIELNRICTPMCGSGWVYTLSKKRGRWQVIAIKGAWIS